MYHQLPAPTVMHSLIQLVLRLENAQLATGPAVNTLHLL